MWEPDNDVTYGSSTCISATCDSAGVSHAAACDICTSLHDVIVNNDCEHQLCRECRHLAVICPVGECLYRLSFAQSTGSSRITPPYIECTECNAQFSLSIAVLLVPHPHSLWTHETAPAPPETTGRVSKLMLPTTKVGASDKCIRVHNVTDDPQIWQCKDLELHVTRCTIYVHYCHRNIIIVVNAREQHLLLRGSHGATLTFAAEITTIRFQAAIPIDNTSFKLSPCRLLSAVASNRIPIGILASADYMYYTHPRYNNMLMRKTLIGAVETHVPQAMCTYRGIQCAFCGRVWCGDTAIVASRCKFHCGIADVPEAALHMIIAKSNLRPVIDASEQCFDPLPPVRPASPLAQFFTAASDELRSGKPGVVAGIDDMVMCLARQQQSLSPETSVPLFLAMCTPEWRATSVRHVYTRDGREMFTYNVDQFNTAEKF